jgi:hypothetical protein
VGRFKYRKDGTKIRRWRCGRAASGGTAACGVGKLLRDEDAMQMFRAALMSLPMEEASIIHNVTELALEAIQDGETGAGDDPKRLELDIEQIQGKKEAVMDSYFSGEIPKSDMQAMNRRYDLQIEDLLQRKLAAERRRRENRDTKSLRAALRSEVAGILTGGIMSDVFCKTMLESLTVFHDRHMELRLRFLPMAFRFSE